MIYQCYQWLKDKILSEEGRKQQSKLKELTPIAERLGCTLPQLAVGKKIYAYTWLLNAHIHTLPI